MDSITVTPKQTTFAPGVDYMTGHADWLFVQVWGGAQSYVYSLRPCMRVRQQ